MTSPTLMIGLGGTGRQTLMQVRRQFLEDEPFYLPNDEEKREKYRAAYGPGRVPHVALLSIDTDNRIDDLLGSINDPRLREATLSDDELLNIQISPDRVKSLYDAPNAHPHYRDWYDFSLSRTGIPEHGCGQTRPWGRVAFFHNEPEIRTRIKNAIERLLRPETREFSKHIGIDLLQSPIKVQLVFSVAGGTGSGMFLDTAFLVRKIIEDFPGNNLVLESVILLPDAFSNNPKHRVFANAYAAMTEIEYYNRAREESNPSGWFPVYWENYWNGYAEKEFLRGPTFHISWLIGTRSRGMSLTNTGARLSNEPRDRNGLMAMMGDWLYLRASPTSTNFGGKIDSYVISNAINIECMEVAKLQVYEGTDAFDPVDGGFEFSRRFGSFGLSKILAPSSLLHEQLAHRLAADFTDDLLQRPKLEASVVEYERKSARKQLSLHSDEDPVNADGDTIPMEIFALSRAIGHEGNVDSIIGTMVEDLENYRDRVCNPADPDNFERGFRDWRSDYRMRKTSDEDPVDERKGDFAKLVLTFAEQKLEADRAKLDELLTTYLATQGRGLTTAEDVLNALKGDYLRVIAEFKDISENEAGACHDLEEDAADRLRFFEAGTFVRKVVTGVCFKLQRNAFKAELMHQIYDATGRHAKAMIELVDIKISELSKLETNLKRIQKDLSDGAAQLGERPQSELNALIPPPVEDKYRSEKGKSFTEASARWGLLPISPIPKGPWPRRDDFIGANAERFQAEILTFAKRPLDHVLRDRTNVLKEFAKKHADPDEYRKELKPLLTNATSWVDVRHDQVNTWDNIGQPMGLNRFIASHGEDRSPERALLHAQARKAGFGEGVSELSTISSPEDQIVFEEHLTGFPPFLISSLKDYRDRAYEPILTGLAEAEDGDFNAALHLEADIDKYDDLVRPDAREAKRKFEAVQIFVKALVYGVLSVELIERTGKFNFSYRKKHLGWEKEDLGTHSRVLRLLAIDGSQLLRELDPLTQTAEARLWDQGNQRRAEILALLDYYQRTDNHPLARNRRFKRVCKVVFDEFEQRAGDTVSRLSESEYVGKYREWSDEIPVGSGLFRLRDI